jgi:hypothetical protein
MSLKLEVSFGEALDKLTILEIKSECIQDVTKLEEVNKEISSLAGCKEAFSNPTIAYIYRLLKWVNKRVWDFTNTIKEMSAEESPREFAKLSHVIFEHNQYRFRCKNILNSFRVGLKEQKSYKETIIHLAVDDETVLYKVYVACLLFDRVVLYGKMSPLSTPNITLLALEDSDEKVVPLSSWKPQELDCNDPIFKY